MATPVVTPYVLMQALQQAQRRGASNDPYGLTAALRGIGGDYDAMNRSVIGANQAATSNAQASARLDSGYYPAEVAAQMAGFGKKTYDDTHHVTMVQAVEEAHKAAAALNLNADTPQYQLFMTQYLTQHGPYKAAADSVKGAREAAKQLQDRGAAQLYVQKAVENKLAFNIAQDYYNQRASNQSMTVEQKNALAQEAQQFAKNLMLTKKVKVVLDPQGNVSATDNEEMNIPIEPQVVATALAMTGNDVPMKVLGVVSAEIRKALDETRANALAAKKIDTPDKAVKPLEDPTRKLLMDELKDAKKARHAMAGKNQTDIEPGYTAALDKEIADLRKQLYGTIATTTQPYDPNALVTKAGGPTPSPGMYGGSPSDFVGSPNMMYGMEPDDATGSPALGAGDIYREGLIRNGA